MKRSQHGDCVAGDIAKTGDKSYHNLVTIYFPTCSNLFYFYFIFEEIRIGGFVNHIIKKDGLKALVVVSMTRTVVLVSK